MLWLILNFKQIISCFLLFFFMFIVDLACWKKWSNVSLYNQIYKWEIVHFSLYFQFILNLKVIYNLRTCFKFFFLHEYTLTFKSCEFCNLIWVLFLWIYSKFIRPKTKLFRCIYCFLGCFCSRVTCFWNTILYFLGEMEEYEPLTNHPYEFVEGNLHCKWQYFAINKTLQTEESLNNTQVIIPQKRI